MAIILPNVKKGRFKRSINFFSLFSKNITLCTSQSLGKVCSYCICYLARLLWLYLEINVLYLIDYSVKSDRWYKYRYIGKIFNKYQLYPLQKCSVNRVNHLKSLVTFMSEATKELIWMNQREEPEVSRDWSSTDLDIEELQLHGEVPYHA